MKKRITRKKGLKEESKGDESDSGEDIEVSYPRNNAERAEADFTGDTMRKVKKKGKYLTKKIGGDMTRRVEFLSRAYLQGR